MNKIKDICEKFYKSKKISFEDFKFLMDLNEKDAEELILLRENWL